MFNLPPNDERLLKLTARGALEQVLLHRQIQTMKLEQFRKALTDVPEEVDPNLPIKPVVKTVTGKDAEAIADKPHYTGDREWDKVEEEETSPFREPFDIKRFRTDGGRAT